MPPVRPATIRVMSKLILRAKAFPWMLLVEAGLLVRGRWRSLPQRERDQLVLLARRSHGWPGNLTPRERAELRRLMLRLDTRSLPGELAALRRAAGKSGNGTGARAMRVFSLTRRGH